ncbi:hypothetical protein COK25_07835 [Bacillus cereus]|uniref:Uncharacterized protein n=1 Tax=Bacillus cereus TaxID=1396 RepID=A0A9X7CNW7_BACCE|nr:hypothetical protein CN489_05380 [Bacillus cereus]PEW62254.1 hypothetical protein CN438_00270 [Bacillus cereus]PEX42886.1 hypothetical protein CN456_24370 [Bacillus cereus]PEZ96281.1 hypothetical protein CN376_03935 [Bacillus cereus]PFF03641.1 hypothetical protein CN323_09715 [Bacillus cereus]
MIKINDGVCKELYYIKFIMNGGGYTMFWLGCFLGYIVGSVITCALLYFGYRSNENKKADMQKGKERKINKRGV